MSSVPPQRVTHKVTILHKKVFLKTSLSSMIICLATYHWCIHFFSCGHWQVKKGSKEKDTEGALWTEVQGGRSTEPRWWCHLVAVEEVDAFEADEMSLQPELIHKPRGNDTELFSLFINHLSL